MKKIRNALFLMFCMVGEWASAQQVEMADGLRSNGKIYIVVIVAAIVIGVVSIYMISIDRKVTRLENKYGPKQ